MNLPRHVDHSAKINNRIDQLLMEDITFYKPFKNGPIRNQQTSNNNDQIRLRLNKNRKQILGKNSKQILNKNSKQSVDMQKQPNITTKSSDQAMISQYNQVSIYLQQQRPLHKRRRHRNTNQTMFEQSQFNNSINSYDDQQQQKLEQKHYRTANSSVKNSSKFKIKKTLSYPQQVRGLDSMDQGEGNDYLRGRNYSGDSEGRETELEGVNTKKQPIQSNMLVPPQKLTPKLIKQDQSVAGECNNPIHKTKNKSKQFLSWQQLQFLSLLYPSESPQQLMLKLLSYYEQQQQYKNSFEQLFQTEEYSRKSQFFRTRNQLGFTIMDESTNQLYSNTNDFDLKFEKVKCTQDNKFKNDYSNLKEECLAALGQKMVQTQVKSSTVETANVNYYTRQYAMPIIIERLEQKNDQAQGKLQMHQQKIKKNQLFVTHKKIDGLKMTQYQQKVAAVLGKNHQYINPNLNPSRVQSQFIHKVYIPINIKGQTFDIDHQPDSTLFQNMSEIDYRRILRDINHLIQKVMSFHRNSTFLKKKNNPLLGGWNIALFIFLLIIIAMLSARCFADTNSSMSQYLDIVVFFILSFMIILILGNSFNNYRQDVKRSSVIKEICQQVSNYIDFVNCSNKNIKWVLGKDFFWLEIWIYLNNKQIRNK